VLLDPLQHLLLDQGHLLNPLLVIVNLFVHLHLAQLLFVVIML
jgi:hypothetical protein